MSIPDHARPKIGLIWAEAHRGVIGSEGILPWHLPEDLAHFRALTSGHPVVMGRATWSSLPDRFRPLPGRENIVVTRNKSWADDGAVVAHSLPEALSLAQVSANDGWVWVIGGAELFHQAIDLADRIEITEIDLNIDGDRHAPSVDMSWRLVEAQDAGYEYAEVHTGESGLQFRFRRYERPRMA